ncbi:MAG: histidine kinase [Ignavibacteria bacterium GWA2_35_9]|nr:MAG: histidine kinase [Ignavibacteria bacterium GWA2_35_9]OGU51084.1 MAG: histidine kinase [Ignavibacteria bacterium GWC2_36_12]
MNKNKLLEKFKQYHFELRHLTVLFVILFAFQLIVSFINKSSIKNFIGNTQSWYQKDSAEELANITSTSLELLLESINPKTKPGNKEADRIIQSFDIIFSQQVLKHNIQEICILVKMNDEIYAIDDGKILFSFLFDSNKTLPINQIHEKAVSMYREIEKEINENEQIKSILTDVQTFHVFVPFVLRGEFIGTVYMKNTPDFSFLSSQIIGNYDETSVIYLSLILLGLLAMYFISSYTVKERDDAQKLLLEEHKKNIKKQINYEKELVFTKRIYHTHHKAEKVMGFIKEDLRLLSPENINAVKYRVSKYSNFISRVIYDMKWFDPPVHTIRNPVFHTNLNEVIKFIVENIFLRVSSKSNVFEIEFETDNNIPLVPVNEFVVWEIIEPLIQNSIDHGGDQDIRVIIKTEYDEKTGKSKIIIRDTGKGILPELLEKNENGIKYLFVENTTTKKPGLQNTGYGCYIAYEMSKRCGWEIDAENLPAGGTIFTIIIKN